MYRPRTAASGARSSSVNSRVTLAGVPMSRLRRAYARRPSTSAFAPTMLCSPISAPSSSVACMPMRLPSPITAPWTMAQWPTAQPRPIVTGAPGSVWITTPSWMLVSAATEIRSMSPRSTAPGHTVTPSSRTTSPITVASTWTKTPGPN